jgi:glycosyltransferase involved in cell wall biosynthesis
VASQSSAPITVRLHGSRTERSAFASINRCWWNELRKRPEVRLCDESCADAADVVIHHDFSSRFGEVLPTGRRRVAVRPWDFGPYPRRWVDTVNREYDELWVHSRWVLDCAVAGGVEPSRVRCMPLGVDPAIYRPDGPNPDLGMGDRFVFAFVGAAVDRKGADLALDAYRRAFGPGDAVALVVKDHTGDVFYRRQSHADAILAAACEAGAAPIVYIDEYLPPHDLAALLRRADVLLLPYRAEGFGCTALESMACGTPPIVPEFGAALDYCDAGTGILVPTRQVKLPIGRSLTTNTLGFHEHVDAVHFCEIPVDRLAAALRAVVAMPRGELAALGRAAAERAGRWTWAASVDAILERVRVLAGL